MLGEAAILEIARKTPTDHPLLQDKATQYKEIGSPTNGFQLSVPHSRAFINFYFSGTIVICGKDTMVGLEFIRSWTVKSATPPKALGRKRRVR